MLRSFILFVLSAGAIWADVPRPDNLVDTLRILQEYYSSTESVESVVIDAQDLSLMVVLSDGTEMRTYPDNIHRQLQSTQTSAEREAMLSHFVRTLARSSVSSDHHAVASNILPIIRGELIVDVGNDNLPVRENWLGDLHIYYVVDFPDHVEYVTPLTLEELGLEPESLAELAAENLVTRDWSPYLEGSGPWMVLLDGYYESSLMLDTRIWESLDVQMGEIIAIALSRDVLVIHDSTIPGAVGLMRSLSEENFDNLSYQVSPEMWVWRQGGWQLY